MVAGKTAQGWKEDLVLEEYIERPWVDVPKLVHAGYAVVHIEALDSRPVALDKVVVRHLEDAGIREVWSERGTKESLEESCTQLRLDWRRRE